MPQMDAIYGYWRNDHKMLTLLSQECFRLVRNKLNEHTSYVQQPSSSVPSAFSCFLYPTRMLCCPMNLLLAYMYSQD